MRHNRAEITKGRPIAKSFLPHQMDIAVVAARASYEVVYQGKRASVADIRTVLTTMSPLISDTLVQQIGGHVDLDIVAKIDTRDRLEERLRAIGPDLVLIGLYMAKPTKSRTLFWQPLHSRR